MKSFSTMWCWAVCVGHFTMMEDTEASLGSLKNEDFGLIPDHWREVHHQHHWLWISGMASAQRYGRSDREIANEMQRLQGRCLRMLSLKGDPAALEDDTAYEHIAYKAWNHFWSTWIVGFVFNAMQSMRCFCSCVLWWDLWWCNSQDWHSRMPTLRLV